MRYLRAKGIRKALRQFHFLCGVKPPYKMKVEIHERLPKYLQVKAHECEFFVPRAALEELEMLGETTREAFELAKTFKVAEVYNQAKKTTSEEGKPSVDVSNVIQAIIGERNERKFVVCTQEVELRKALRSVPGVPLIYLNRSVLVFEDISRATLAIVRQEEKANMAKLDVNEKRKLEQMEEGDHDGETYAEQQQRLTKKRAKGPNPLSMKKSSKKKVRAKKKKD
ncbi:hypothetical protein BBJ28_00003631 [Nothophytophthora sp. Chile5]|nr:hypothetical protein BBJ28_00003631 [Nothophytophthora sp. Chile5]